MYGMTHGVAKNVFTITFIQALGPAPEADTPAQSAIGPGGPVKASPPCARGTPPAVTAGEPSRDISEQLNLGAFSECSASWTG